MQKQPKRSMITRIGLASASLTTLLTLSACNATLVPVDRPVGPPVALYSESTERHLEAPPRGSSNADVTLYALSLKDALRAAYDDRAAIREWAVCALGEPKVKNGGCKFGGTSDPIPPVSPLGPPKRD